MVRVLASRMALVRNWHSYMDFCRLAGLEGNQLALLGDGTGDERMAAKSNWIWYGHAGHFICASWCRFHLCTKVGKYLVSTVGEYFPERSSREIHAKYEDPKWLAANQLLKGDYFDAAYMKRFGFQDIGCDRKYETMVFLAGKTCDSPKCKCGIPAISGSELDYAPANDAGTAAANHHKLCAIWAKKRKG